MASQGYDFIFSESDGYMPVEFPGVNLAIQTGQSQFIQIDENNVEEIKVLLPNATQQTIITLRREAQVIGIVFLESSMLSTDENTFGFLTRLADHASIAITNANLYAEVQAANQAKSDFVSFVSHELKTPMTSIRGFTDLLASGVVGEINDNQTNFLSTIHEGLPNDALK